jgi:hypothetical protein
MTQAALTKSGHACFVAIRLEASGFDRYEHPVPLAPAWGISIRNAGCLEPVEEVCLLADRIPFLTRRYVKSMRTKAPDPNLSVEVDRENIRHLTDVTVRKRAERAHQEIAEK